MEGDQKRFKAIKTGEVWRELKLREVFATRSASGHQNKPLFFIAKRHIRFPVKSVLRGRRNGHRVAVLDMLKPERIMEARR